MTIPASAAGSNPETEPGPEPDPRSRFTAGDRLIDADEVARKLGGKITALTVTRRWRKWGLPAHRIGKELRWWESDVYQYIQNHRA